MKSCSSFIRMVRLPLLLLAVAGLCLWWQTTLKIHDSEIPPPSNELGGIAAESIAHDVFPDELADQEGALTGEHADATAWTLGELLGIPHDHGDRSWVDRFDGILKNVHGEYALSRIGRERHSEALAGIEPDGPDVLHAMRGFRSVPGIDPAVAGSYRAFYAWNPAQDIQTGIDPLGLTISVDGMRWHLRAAGLRLKATKRGHFVKINLRGNQKGSFRKN